MLLIATAHPVLAQQQRGDDGPVKLELRQVPMRARTHAPAQVEARLTYDGTGVLEGALVVELRDGPSLRAHYRSPDLALAAGPQTQRLMLPTGPILTSDGQLTLRAWFDTGKERLPLGDFPLLVGERGRRVAAIGVSSAWPGDDRRYFSFLQTLRLERFSPELSDRELTTAAAYVAARDMPASAISYATYDLVVLIAEGFSALGERQLDALAAWVRAGGSLLVVPTTPVEAMHVRFLNDLAAEGSLEAVFAPTDRGGVTPVSGAPLTTLRPGLGRLVVLTRLPEFEGAAPPGWDEAVAFLWKVRQSQMPSIEASGRWRTDLQSPSHYEEQTRAHYYRSQQYPGSSSQLALEPDMTVPAGHEALAMLMPETVRVMPLWMILALLAAFVVVIGPADYFLLGLINRRRFTWVAFPLATVAFTLATVAISEGYLGRQDHRRVLRIVDVGAGGRVLRESRLELLFAAGSRQAPTRVARGLFSPVQDYQLAQAYSNYGGGYYGKMSLTDHPLRYEGRVPTQFTVVQPLEQWNPQLNHVLAIEPGDPVGVLDWDAVDRRGAHGLTLGADELRRVQSMASGGGFDGGVFVVNENETVHLAGKTWDQLARRQVGDEYPHHYYYQYQGMYYGANAGLNFLHEITVRPRRGLFSIVSQISPAGDGAMEDLAVMDATNPDERVLMVVQRESEGYVVYRRVYR